jgi:hypothetical protein
VCRGELAIGGASLAFTQGKSPAVIEIGGFVLGDQFHDTRP